jgi:hypothetical protein
MVSWRNIAIVAGMLLTSAPGCRLLQSGPSEQDVVAAVKGSPPSPPTAGPTYLAQVESVQVQERGPYNADGKYWPVRVRVKGGARIKLTGILQLGVLGDRAKETVKPVEFVEEARFTNDDFGNWRVSYNYDPHGPKWRLGGRDTSVRPGLTSGSTANVG